MEDQGSVEKIHFFWEIWARRATGVTAPCVKRSIFQGGSGTEPEPETGTVGTVFFRRLTKLISEFPARRVVRKWNLDLIDFWGPFSGGGGAGFQNGFKLGGFKKALLQNPREMIRGRIFSEMIRISARKSELQAKSRSYRPKVRVTARQTPQIRAESPGKGARIGLWCSAENPP